MTTPAPPVTDHDDFERQLPRAAQAREGPHPRGRRDRRGPAPAAHDRGAARHHRHRPRRPDPVRRRSRGATSWSLQPHVLRRAAMGVAVRGLHQELLNMGTPPTRPTSTPTGSPSPSSATSRRSRHSATSWLHGALVAKRPPRRPHRGPRRPDRLLPAAGGQDLPDLLDDRPGDEVMSPSFGLLDMTAYGRREEWEDPARGVAAFPTHSFLRTDEHGAPMGPRDGGRPVPQWTRPGVTGPAHQPGSTATEAPPTTTADRPMPGGQGTASAGSAHLRSCAMTSTGTGTVEISANGLTFRARVAGPRDGRVVLLLHGFPQTSRCWAAQLDALAAAGHRAVAVDQRGFSPGARPADPAAYAMAHLVDDVLGIIDVLGTDQVDLVGHDFGGAVAWTVAGHHPGRSARSPSPRRPTPGVRPCLPGAGPSGRAGGDGGRPPTRTSVRATYAPSARPHGVRSKVSYWPTAPPRSARPTPASPTPRSPPTSRTCPPPASSPPRSTGTGRCRPRPARGPTLPRPHALRLERRRPLHRPRRRRGHRAPRHRPLRLRRPRRRQPLDPRTGRPHLHLPPPHPPRRHALR